MQSVPYSNGWCAGAAVVCLPCGVVCGVVRRLTVFWQCVCSHSGVGCMSCLLLRERRGRGCALL